MFRRRCYADEQDHCCQPGYYWFCVIDIVTLNSLAQYRACVRQIEADKNDGCVYLRGYSTASAARELARVCLPCVYARVNRSWLNRSYESLVPNYERLLQCLLDAFTSLQRH